MKCDIICFSEYLKTDKKGRMNPYLTKSKSQPDITIQAIQTDNISSEILKEYCNDSIGIQIPQGVTTTVEGSVDLEILHKLILVRQKEIQRVLVNIRKTNVVYPFGFTGSGKTTF